MKLKADPEKEHEQLDFCSFEQSTKLKEIGFDWICDHAFDADGNEVNWTTKDFLCWRPTIALALKFVRKRFKIYHNMYIRSWDTNLFGFSVSHSLGFSDITTCDISEDKNDPNYDGVVSFDYDESESIALDYAIAYIHKNFERDFSWLKPGIIAYRVKYDFSCEALECEALKIEEVNEVLRCVRIKMNFKYESEEMETWLPFHQFFETNSIAEEAAKLEQIEEDKKNKC